MANAKKRKTEKTGTSRKKQPPRPSEPPESQTAEAATVAWTLSVMTVTGCDLATAGLWFYLRENQGHEMLILLSGVLYFAAICMAITSLALLPVVCRLRRTLPPRGLMYFAVLVGIAPLVTLAGQLLSQ